MKKPEQIKQFIKDIPNEVKFMRYEQVVDACNEYFPDLPFHKVNVNNEHNNKDFKLIFRSRVMHDNTPHDFVSDIDVIKENKKELIKGFGRVNKIGEPMFYGAFDCNIAAFESISKGNYLQEKGVIPVTIGCWRVKSEFSTIRIPFSEKYIKKLESIDKSSRFTNEQFLKQENFLRKLVKDDLIYDILKLFTDSFANFYAYDDNDYYLSNYYKDRAFNRINGFNYPNTIDAILYPSVAASFAKDNIVIKPKISRTKMEFLNAFRVQVISDEDKIQFNKLTGTAYPDENGKLKWT